MSHQGAFDLDLFLKAQEAGYSTVVAELKRGQKKSHWIWYVFPQLKGLGYSSMAQKYGIASAAEARAYLEHPILGARLRECTELVNQLEDSTAGQIFGTTDAMKFRSCMTLFAHAAPHETLFGTALDKYYGGEPDRTTLKMLDPAL